MASFFNENAQGRNGRGVTPVLDTSWPFAVATRASQYHAIPGSCTKRAKLLIPLLSLLPSPLPRPTNRLRSISYLPPLFWIPIEAIVRKTTLGLPIRSSKVIIDSGKQACGPQFQFRLLPVKSSVRTAYFSRVGLLIGWQSVNVGNAPDITTYATHQRGGAILLMAP